MEINFENFAVEIQNITAGFMINLEFTNVRGHSGIRGNERRGVLAKDTT